MTPEDAFKNSCESITGPITKTISKQGIYKVRAASPSKKRARRGGLCLHFSFDGCISVVMAAFPL